MNGVGQGVNSWMGDCDGRVMGKGGVGGRMTRKKKRRWMGAEDRVALLVRLGANREPASVFSSPNLSSSDS